MSGLYSCYIERIFLVITYLKEVPIQRVCDFGCSSYVCMCQSLCSRADQLIACNSSTILNTLLPSLSVNYGSVVNSAPSESR